MTYIKFQKVNIFFVNSCIRVYIKDYEGTKLDLLSVPTIYLPLYGHSKLSLDKDVQPHAMFIVNTNIAIVDQPHMLQCLK